MLADILDSWRAGGTVIHVEIGVVSKDARCLASSGQRLG
jgi:hypothetical protein